MTTFADLIIPHRIAGFIEVVRSFCASCALRDVCQGGCKAAAQACNGSLSAEEAFLYHNRAQAEPLVEP